MTAGQALIPTPIGIRYLWRRQAPLGWGTNYPYVKALHRPSKVDGSGAVGVVPVGELPLIFDLSSTGYHCRAAQLFRPP